MVALGQVRLDPLITAAYALDDWSTAFDRTARADCMKLVMDRLPTGTIARGGAA